MAHGPGNIFDAKPKRKPVTPPGNALLDLEKQAQARQDAGANPSLTPRDVAVGFLRTLLPPAHPQKVAGKTVQTPLAFTGATAALTAAAQLPGQVGPAREAAVKIAHPSPANPPSLGRNVEGLLGGAFGFPQARTKYEPRTVAFNEKVQQLPKARSRITNVGERLVDKASVALQSSPHVADVPGLRLMTVGERVAKAAGREQRRERIRAAAAQAAHLDALKHVKAGSPDDVANFWYAQLPASHRNAAGLALVRGKQADELGQIASGQALADLGAREAAVKAELGAVTEMKAKGPLLKELDDIRVAKTDLPQRADDIAASVAQLDELIAKPPAANDAAIRAVHALGGERQRILVEAGRLHPDRAAARTGLVSRFVGLAPTGEEAYIGHRLARPENSRFPYVPSGGVGRVGSPQGMSRNDLVLARSGRLRPSLRVAAEDFGAAQVFHQANVARSDLSAMGPRFAGHVPEGSSLVNPRGRTVPADWKNEDLAQFHEGYDDVDKLRDQAKQILDGFVATDRAGFERMKQQALDEGVQWDELRVVPNRLVERYYSQFRALRARGPAGKAYDTAVDAVAASIVFARIGYIPKNLAQNLILSLPHQGPLLLRNAVYAGQLMRDPAIRPLLLAEINTGATSALAQEALHRKVIGAAAGFVTPIADVPFRATAFVHEAAAAGVLPQAKLLLSESDRKRFLRLLTDQSERPLLNDVHHRSNDAMADFTRLTPDQSRMARRFLIIPGWLMAGTRYPFHFALTHPIRSALLAYIALGEPGAPNELHFNHPINEYFRGSSFRQGIETPWGRVRIGSLSPVSMPWEIGTAAVGSLQGKTGPFDYTTPQLFDMAQPLAASVIRLTQGEGVGRSLTPLAPNYRFVRGLISPSESAVYPEDATRLGRLKRELGVVPIKINDPVPKGTRSGNVFDTSPSSGGSSSGGNIFDK